MTGRAPDDILIGSVLTIAGFVTFAGAHPQPTPSEGSEALAGGPKWREPWRSDTCPLDERRAAACRGATWRPIRRTMP